MAGTKKQKPLSGTLQKKRQKILMWKWFGVIFLGILCVGTILYGLNRKEIQISNISVRGVHVLNPEEIKNFTASFLLVKYRIGIPRANIFFYPKRSLEQALREAFPRIETIYFKRDWWDGLALVFTEREARYVWCGKEVTIPREETNPCYFFDDSGDIFSEAPFYSGNLFLEFYGSLVQGEGTHPIGGTVLPEDIFNRLRLFIPILLSSEFSPERIANLGDGDFEIHLARGGKILLAEKNDWAKSGQNLLLALEAEPLKTKLEKEREKLLYIDLRFGSKVYYKFE